MSSRRFAHRAVRVFLFDGVLDRYSALHCLYRAGEVGDNAVAGDIEDPASMASAAPFGTDGRQF
jgi:hypothetical protein